MLVTGYSCLAMALANIVIPAVAQGQAVPVTGLTTGINESFTDETTRDLFILGLSELQNKSESDPLSYFQISGIHGRPFISWNGVENVTGSEPMKGFCPHGAAAEKFRIPYWDWAGDYTLPASVMDPRVTVNGPHGQVDIPNPLYSYRWQQFPLNTDPEYFPKDDDKKDCWLWNETKRQPDGNGIDQFNIVNNNLASRNLKDVVVSFLFHCVLSPLSVACSISGTSANQTQYRVFTAAKTYEDMASNSDPGPSLEHPHDLVHSSMSAAMLWPEYAAFDPLFWLHHANVDRLYALWQAINYNNTYQTQSRSIGPLYATPAGDVTADSPLKPFYQGDDSTSFHTGKSVAALATFGYTYPEINDWSLSHAETRKAVVTQVNQLYSNGANGISSSRRRRVQQQDRRRQQQQDPTKEYYAQISVERAELQLPCTISVMLGDDKAGQMSLLSMPTSGVTHAEVPLTRALNRALASDTAAAKNKAMMMSDAKFVTSKLSKLFQVEIRKADGTVIPTESVPSLSVEIQGEEVVAASRIDEFPKYGAVTKLAGVGIGKLARGDANTRL
ncbi:tyrosinase precursor [Apiospora saccharicola]|uniref:tyrosinase n=1 Tax=Apiospora saccharicola TaxID=335842 RepID=A0ABR1U7J8_9PEZI